MDSQTSEKVIHALLSEVERLKQPPPFSPTPVSGHIGDEKMKAVVQSEWGDSSKLKFMTVPKPKPMVSQVLIRVVAAGLNPVDWKVREGYLKGMTPMMGGRLSSGVVLGWECAGVVEAVNWGDASGLKVGDRVFARPENEDWGCYAEYAIASTKAVAKMPDSMGFEEAAAVPLAGLIAYQALFNLGNLQKGQHVLVHAGSGGVGGFAIQLAVAKGAIVSTTCGARNIEYCKGLGATTVVDYKTQDFSVIVKDVDLVLNMTGSETATKSLACMKNGGNLISIDGGPDEALCKAKSITFKSLFVAPDGKELAEIAALIDAGKVTVEIDKTFPLAEAAAAQDHIKKGGNRGKSVLICAEGAVRHSPRFQQTMLRVKDPKVSVPFYKKNFDMKLVHWVDFPQWKFAVYFLERQREGQTSPECTMEKTSAECEKHINNMTGACVELTHNHGTESDDSFSAWSGNTGRDAGKPGDVNYAEEPAARGFGHIAFNCDDVYAATDKLMANGVKFQKKPDEGNMKGLAFALDPDGYWVEIARRAPIFKEPNDYWNLSQTMLRVKDGNKSRAYYEEHFGMTCVRQMDMPKWKFSLIFMVSATQDELRAAFDAQSPEEQASCGGPWENFDPTKSNEMTKTLWNVCLELTWNHGTETDPNFKVHDGNADPQGFGHIGFLVDNLDAACETMEQKGVVFKKKPSGGNMRGLAFAYDPDGYWVEIIDRKSPSYSGVCANY
jgi:lactoylglutathione lyase